jgi:hypothetical protein
MSEGLNQYRITLKIPEMLRFLEGSMPTKARKDLFDRLFELLLVEVFKHQRSLRLERLENAPESAYVFCHDATIKWLLGIRFVDGGRFIAQSALVRNYHELDLYKRGCHADESNEKKEN